MASGQCAHVGHFPWQKTVATSWRRWAGHMARLAYRAAARLAYPEPLRWLSRLLQWRDAWWLKTGRYANWSVAANWLHRGHRFVRESTVGCGDPTRSRRRDAAQNNGADSSNPLAGCRMLVELDRSRETGRRN